MKKVKLLLVMISLFIITSCTTGNITQNSEEYNITYFVNGEEVLLQPQKYTEGKGCNLPTPEVEEGYVFSGWYNNYTYQGNEITNISITDNGHKTLFGKIESLNYIKPKISEQPLRDVAMTNGFTRGLPSVGEPKVLVIPVEFTDYPAPTGMVECLNKAFFGTSEDTGWESLQSYYYKSSYGKLKITGTVLQPYNTGKKSTKYIYNDNADYEMIKAALEHYDDQIDYSDYDTDKDGYIDSIYIVYTKSYDANSDLWWAYTYEYFTETEEYYDNVEADFYCFSSYQFFFDKLNGEKIKYNSETIIHETGHLLGLDDYYDYDNKVGPKGGIGGGDMMDYNVGDHNAYSKLIMGWISPYILTGNTITLDLNSFEKSGDCIMICKDWNGSVFSEYYIIDFYTPTGLNEFCKGVNGLFSISGIRIYHVDATIEIDNETEDIWTMTKYDNSYTSHRLISLIEADGRNNISYGDCSEDSDLFIKGKICSNLKWYDNTSASFTLIVNDITSSKANITIAFN